MTRILDIDLDFFVHGAAHWRDRGDGRLDAGEYPPWAHDEALAFLHDRCSLVDPLPGFAVENHGELFNRWGSAIENGKLAGPLSVTHVDAHSDLGLGDATYVTVLSDLLFLPVDERPPKAELLANDGNYLALAIACRWISDLTLVRNGLGGGRPGDLMVYYMEEFDLDADHLQFVAMKSADISAWKRDRHSLVAAREPRVPLQHMAWREFTAPQPFDAICLARSPDFTPVELDPLFEEIRERFIDEDALGFS